MAVLFYRKRRRKNNERHSQTVNNIAYALTVTHRYTHLLTHTDKGEQQQKPKYMYIYLSVHSVYGRVIDRLHLRSFAVAVYHIDGNCTLFSHRFSVCWCMCVSVCSCCCCFLNAREFRPRPYCADSYCFGIPKF